MLPLIPLLTQLLPLAGAAAPLIGKALGASEATQELVSGIAKAVTGAPTTESAVEALRTDPNLALQFETAVLAKETEIRRMVYADLADQREKELADREGARGRDVEVRKLTGGSNTRPNIMLVVVNVVLLVIVWQIATVTDLKDGVLAIYSMIAGAILKMDSDAFAFEFGSSRGSKEKSAQIGDLMKGARP